MKINRVIFSVLALLFMSFIYGTACAEEDSGHSLKEQLKTDKQAIKAQKQEIREHAGAAKTEEKQLKGQIHQAMASGDKATAVQLKNQLKTTHAENVQQKHQDKKELRTVKHEMKKDLKTARHSAPRRRGLN